MRRLVNIVGGFVVILAVVPLWLYGPLLVMPFVPSPPGCLDGPCVWTERDGPTPLLATEGFWLVCGVAVSVLMLAAGVHAIVKEIDWAALRRRKDRRPLDLTRAAERARTLGLALGELGTRPLEGDRRRPAHVLAALNWLAAALTGAAALAARPEAGAYQVAIGSEVIVPVAVAGVLAASGYLVALLLRAAHQIVFAAWGGSLAFSFAAWFVLRDLSETGTTLGPLVGTAVFAGHAAGVVAVALTRPAQQE